MLCPEAVADSRAQPPCPSRTLGGGSRGEPNRDEPVEAGCRIVPELPAPAGIYDDGHTFYSQACLGNVGGQHHLAPVSRGYGALLVGKRKIAIEGGDEEGLRPAFSFQQFLAAADFATAREEGQYVAGGFVNCPLHRTRNILRAVPLCRLRQVYGVYRKTLSLAGNNRRISEQPRHRSAVKGCRHHDQLQILPQSLLHIQAKGQCGISVEAPLVEFIEDDHSHTVEEGV